MTRRMVLMCVLFAGGILGEHAGTFGAEKSPGLPERDGAVEIAAQEWPRRPGPRTVRVLVHYPQGKLENVSAKTGLMLSLHNWGGTDFVGTANPRELANRLNLVVLGVNYLQSGAKESLDGPEPYDFGYLQTLDALRALHFAFDGLKTAGKPFAEGRVYCTGGSGGGNLTLMANKFAPRTFACVIDLCGMPKLSDDFAFNGYGPSLNARYHKDPKNPNYLSVDEQEIRYVGNPAHLALMKKRQPTAKIVVVHGTEDITYRDADEMVRWMKEAGLDVEPHFIKKEHVDGKVFTSAGHALGNRTEIVFKTAGKYLDPASPAMLVRPGKTDFERREKLIYPTTNGQFVISYEAGFPVGSFERAAETPTYPDPTDLMTVWEAPGKFKPVKTVADWETRRGHTAERMQLVQGSFPPTPLIWAPLSVASQGETMAGKVRRIKLTYRSDTTSEVPAYLFLPAGVLPDQKPAKKLPAVLCLHQTTKAGKDETAGVRGNPDMKYALELAERGFVTFVPDYPEMGGHRVTGKPAHGYQSGSMNAVWNNVKAVDYLRSLDYVDPDRIGVIGHSLGGHNAIFTAFFDPRIKAVVSSCGFTSLRKDDLPSWTGPTYMPRIKTVYGTDIRKLPFDFHELVAGLAPRPFLACAAEKDDDFDASGVRDVMKAAAAVYRLYGAEKHLEAVYPDAPHSFPAETRKKAYDFLAEKLGLR